MATPSTIDQNFINNFRGSLDLALQQPVSKLRPHVRVEMQKAEYDYYDRIGSTSFEEILTRHADTPLNEITHSRRRAHLQGFQNAFLIDKPDLVRMLIDPTSAYIQDLAMAMGRKIDDLIIEAAFGTAYSGKSGATSVTFPSGSEVAVNYVESGSAADSNLTIGKLRRVRTLFDENEAANEADAHLVAVIGPNQKQALLRSTEVTSGDYNTIRALVNGEINTFMGFNFIVSNRLTKDANNVRSCLFFEKRGLLLAVGEELTVRVQERSDKSFSTQVYARFQAASTRLWEEKVYRVKCDEDL